MVKEIVTINGVKGAKIHVKKWLPDEKPKACMMIIHGLSEHGGRYEDFATYMVKNGFVVWAYDQRQHGMSISHDEIGVLNDDDSWESMTDDAQVVYSHMIQQYSGLKVIALGHSMGSLILRSFLQKHQPELSGAIIMGTPVTPKIKSMFGVVGGQLAYRIKGLKKTPHLHKLAIGGFGKNIKDNTDWTTRDLAIIEKNKKDDLFGFCYNSKFYLELSKGTLIANNSAKMKQCPKMPILLISGQEDPAGELGKGVRRLSNKYKSLGVENELVLMPNMRHEVLNEIDRRETFELLGQWVNARNQEVDAFVIREEWMVEQT